MARGFSTVFQGMILTAAVGLASLPGQAVACGTEPYLGSVCAFGFNFCPRGYASANGQLFSISQNSALFSLLGTMYGGDGRTTFGLPDLRGRSLVGAGQGNGLSPITQGEVGGTEQVTLTAGQMAAHTHGASTNVDVTAQAHALGGAGNSDSPSGNSWATVSRQNSYSTAAPNVVLNANAVSATAAATTTVNPSGNSQPINIRPPFTGITYCVATEGIFPPRN